MTRDTVWFGHGADRVAGMAPHLEEKFTCDELIDYLLTKLALYEDSGLAPEELVILKRLKDAGGRDFTVKTPKGDLRVWAKMAVDDPEDYPGVYIDIVNPQGDGVDDLLCCVEYDTVADGIYARVYADGDEPSDSIRFENYD